MHIVVIVCIRPCRKIAKLNEELKRREETIRALTAQLTAAQQDSSAVSVRSVSFALFVVFVRTTAVCPLHSRNWRGWAN